MKKVLVCALAALMLMTTCMSALAAPLTAENYVTTTTYVLGTEGTKLQVNTHADAAAGTMLTYLAHTGAEPTDLSIVYIDQQTADDEGADFSYTTSKDNITGVTVKYGSSLNNAAIDASYATRTLTVSYNDATESIVLPSEYNSAVITTIPLNTLKVVGNTPIVSFTATVDGADVAEYVKIADDGTITLTDCDSFANGKTVVITAEFEPEIEAPDVDSDTVASGRFTGFEGGEAVEKMTMFGYATGATGTNWGGIIVGNDAAAVEAFKIGDNVDGITVYPAIYRKDAGAFAVQLVNKDKDNLELTTKDWYGKIYIGTDDKAYNYSDVKTIALSEQAEY